MANHTYQNLVELQSLDNQIKKHLELCEEERKRLLHIEKLRKREEEKLHEARERDRELHQSECELEKQLHETNKVLEQNGEHQKVAKNESQLRALESEFARFEAQKSELEDKEFAVLEEREELEKLINECQSFIEGSEQTFKEVSTEVEHFTQKEQLEIDNLERRREALLAELPKNFREAFLNVLKTHRYHSPLSFISERKCGKCHFQLDSMLASDVFTGASPAFCPGCKRLLIDRAAI